MRGKVVLLLLVGIIVAAVSPCFSAGPVGPLALGAKAGLSLATMYGDDVEDAEFKLGFGVGAFMSYSLSPMFAIQPELLYVQKGYKVTEESGGEEVTLKMKLDYLEIPVLAKLSLPTGGGVAPNFFIGPALAIKLSAKVEAEVMGVKAEADVEDVTGFDFGLTAGGGVGFPVGKGEIVTDVRFTLGFISADDSEAQFDVKNMDFLFGIGYALHL